MSKMYILVKNDLSHNQIALTCAHGSLSCYLKFKDNDDMIKWKEESFKKVICLVDEKEFERAKEFAWKVVMTESSLGGRETALVFCPREEYPKPFKFYKLYKD
jgi:peptidyl-tRNA hydrolase